MRPDDQQDRRVGTPLVPQRSVLYPQTRPSHHQEAAANVVRGQLQHIYEGNTSTPTPQTTPITKQETPTPTPTQQSIETESPYHRTHSTVHEVQADQWKQYHSAWQEYYQKYYERYYIGQLHHTQKALEEKVRANNEVASTKEPLEEASFSKDEAVYDLRNRLLRQLRTRATKVRKSKHFVPLAAAGCVMLVFLFLQYNRMIFANVEAYVSPGNIDPTNIIVDPVTDITVGPNPKLIIPKINVEVPVDYTAQPDYDSQMKAMENGVAWFGIPGANSKPGQVGNTVLSGHSSNDIIDGGSYKFIFARLDHLTNGDTIYANYEGKRYTYTVVRKEVVKPSEVNRLIYATDKPMLTLITCTPLGTALNRLLITAEQVSPNPKEASSAPETSSTQTAEMPGNSPTFIQRLFGQG